MLAPWQAFGSTQTTEPHLEDRIDQQIRRAQELAAGVSEFKAFYDRVVADEANYYTPVMTDEELMHRLQTEFDVSPNETSAETFFFHNNQCKDLKDKPYLQKLLFHPFTKNIYGLLKDVLGIKLDLNGFEKIEASWGSIVDVSYRFDEYSNQIFNRETIELIASPFFNMNIFDSKKRVALESPDKVRELSSIEGAKRICDKLAELYPINIPGRIEIDVFFNSAIGRIARNPAYERIMFSQDMLDFLGMFDFESELIATTDDDFSDLVYVVDDLHKGKFRIADLVSFKERFPIVKFGELMDIIKGFQLYSSKIPHGIGILNDTEFYNFMARNTTYTDKPNTNQLIYEDVGGYKRGFVRLACLYYENSDKVEEMESIARRYKATYNEPIEANHLMLALKNPGFRTMLFHESTLRELERNKAENKGRHDSRNLIWDKYWIALEDPTASDNLEIKSDAYFAKWLIDHNNEDLVQRAVEDRDEIVRHFGEVLDGLDHTTNQHLTTKVYEDSTEYDNPLKIKYRTNGKEEWVNIREAFRRMNEQALSKLNPIDLIKVGVFLENIRDTQFRYQIGLEMERDIYDIFGEHGGVLVLDEQFKLQLVPLKSKEATEKRLANNNDFTLEDVDLYTLIDGKPIIAVYHFHATDNDDKEHAFANDGDKRSARETYVDGVLMTKLPGKRFNFKFFTPDGIELDIGNCDYIQSIIKIESPEKERKYKQSNQQPF